MEDDNKKDLTLRQRMFVSKYCESGNATEAASQVYNCKNARSAEATGREVLANPRIQVKIHELMKEMGLDDGTLLKKHQELLQHPDPMVQLRALDMAYKLNGSYKSIHLVLKRDIRDNRYSFRETREPPKLTPEDTKQFLAEAMQVEKDLQRQREENEKNEKGLR